MGENQENKKNNPWPDAIIGGMFGVAVGWFYKREATQSAIKQVKDSELARTIASDVYDSTQSHLRDYFVKGFESKANNLLQNHDPSSSDNAEEDNSEEETKSNSPDEPDENEQSYDDLKKENEQLDKMISYLEKKFEELN